MYSVNIKPSRQRFGFSLAWDWQLCDKTPGIIQILDIFCHTF
jgi:hypothetical protein